MTMIAAALNEPAWLKAARGASVQIPDAQIPPPGDGAEFVSSCLHHVGIPAPTTIGELSMWGAQVDLGKRVPPVGTIVIVNQPKMWIPADRNSAAAQLPNEAKAHVGFLVRQTTGNIYVLGEGVVRAFPKKAASNYRWPEGV